MAKVFSRTVAFNPYPTQWRLPGDKTPERQDLQPIQGAAQRCIVHALTFHEIPRQIDTLICMLPSDKVLQRLNPIQRDYLSFSVYSLKQMVGAGTISADTAWSLFYGEWNTINVVEEGNFVGMRRVFMEKTLEGLTKEFGKSFIRRLEKRYFRDKASKVDLLRFEFLARAGEAGLAQYERYSEWTANLIMDEKTCKDMSEALKDEYRKTLWLEMRTIEGQAGIKGLDQDVGKYILYIEGKDEEGIEGKYIAEDHRAIKGTIDIFKNIILKDCGSAIDQTIKAEIGHWMLDLFCIYHLDWGWVSELMDRMNASGYTERIQEYLAMDRYEDIPPEVKAYLYGGSYIPSVGVSVTDPDAAFPQYPQEFPKERMNSIERQEQAEYVERLIRKRIVRALKNKQIGKSDAYQIYRKIGLYVLLLTLEETPKKGVLEKLEAFDLKEIDEYYSSYEEIAFDELVFVLDERDPYIRGRAAKALGMMGDKSVIPKLEALLDSNDYFIRRDRRNFARGNVAKALIRLRGLKEGSREYKKLYAHQLIMEGRWDEVEALGELGRPAVFAAQEDKDILFSNKATDISMKIRRKIRDKIR